MDKEQLNKLAQKSLITSTVGTSQQSLIASETDLREAISQLNAGDIGLCGHYLIRAIPGLWPLGKILGA